MKYFTPQDTKKIVSEYNQEIPQPQTADNPMVILLQNNSKSMLVTCIDIKNNSQHIHFLDPIILHEDI